MVINFRVCGISRGACKLARGISRGTYKLARTATLIKKKKVTVLVILDFYSKITAHISPTRIDNYINMNKNTIHYLTHDHKELIVILDYVDFWFNNIS